MDDKKSDKALEFDDKLDIFDNPRVKSAMSKMSPEQLEEYKRMGKEMYDAVNYVNSTILTKPPSPMIGDDMFDKEENSTAMAYVINGIKSGLLEEDMTDDEKVFAEQCFGKDWYNHIVTTYCGLQE
jgi:hypothetical protein